MMVSVVVMEVGVGDGVCGGDGGWRYGGGWVMVSVVVMEVGVGDGVCGGDGGRGG